MNVGSGSPSEQEALAARVSRFHLNQRLGIEDTREPRVFGQGFNFFHIENWITAHFFVRLVLKLTLLYRRGQRNAMALRVRENDVSIVGLPPSFDGFTLLHISDPHLDMNPGLTPALTECVENLRYDVAVITGDLRARTSGSHESAMRSLGAVREKMQDPVYTVLGNHDSIRMVPRIEAMGIRVLLNESVPLSRGDDRIFLAGIDDPHYFRADNMEKAADGIPDDAVSVLLAHSPEIYKQAAHAGFSLMLCGHTHGGQICLPGGTPLIVNARCPRRYCNGPWRYHSLAGYTSAGSGVSLVDVRFNCPPEVTLHRLRSQSPPPREGAAT